MHGSTKEKINLLMRGQSQLPENRDGTVMQALMTSQFNLLEDFHTIILDFQDQDQEMSLKGKIKKF
jgi:hypothetical protein